MKVWAFGRYGKYTKSTLQESNPSLVNEQVQQLLPLVSYLNHTHAVIHLVHDIV